MAYVKLTQMTTNMLDPVRGWWDERQLSRVCPVTDDGVLAGMVGYLDTNNRFVVGGGAASKNKMPLFARGGARDNDAIRYEGNMASQRATKTQGTPARVGVNDAPVSSDVGISCLVGTGAYELGTTAFVNGVVAGDLLMADPAVAFNAVVGGSGKGKLAKFAVQGGGASLYSGTTAGTNNNQIVGIATSDSPSVDSPATTGVKNQYGVKMLYFYVNWWPAI